MTTKSAIAKLRSVTQGNIEVMSDDDLDLLAKFDASNVVRSRPNPKRVGQLDRWECWIERRDMLRFTEVDLIPLNPGD